MCAKQNKTVNLKDKSRGIRLHKALADAGIGSRRACEQMIEELRVSVNGTTISEMPVWVDPANDTIKVDNRAIDRPATRGGHMYIMVYKPRGFICSNSDPQGRRRVIDLIPHKTRLHCVGRLDLDSSGFVLLTNDGGLTQKLTHPKFGVPKTYRVTIKGRLQGTDVEKLKRGFWLAEKKTGHITKAQAARVKLISRDRDKSTLEITLREGRNREIRRMMVRLGHRVKKLRRIAIGSVQLKGVGVGQWRLLTRIEISSLRRAAKRAENVAENITKNITTKRAENITKNATKNTVKTK